jgi:hypothetical protein
VVFEAVALAGDVGGLDHSSDGSEKDVVEKPADLGRRAVVGGGTKGGCGALCGTRVPSVHGSIRKRTQRQSKLRDEPVAAKP